MNINNNLNRISKVFSRYRPRAAVLAIGMFVGMISGALPLRAAPMYDALSTATGTATATAVRTASPSHPEAASEPLSEAEDTASRPAAASPVSDSPEAPVSDLSAGILRAHRVILLGERHDHPEHHANQARWLEALAEAGPVAVVVEMIGLDQLGAIEAPPQTAEDWAAELDWANSGWPEFELYAPIFEVIARYRLPVLAGTVGPPSGHGMQAHVDNLKAQLETTPAPPTAVARALEADVMAGHCNLLPAEMVPAMAEVQWLKDAFMAAQVRTGLEFAERVVLIAGNGHSQSESGVPVHLADLDDALLSVVQVERGAVERGEGDAQRPGSAGLEGEKARTVDDGPLQGGPPPSVVVLTEAIPMPDHCAELRAHFGGSAKD